MLKLMMGMCREGNTFGSALSLIWQNLLIGVEKSRLRINQPGLRFSMRKFLIFATIVVWFDMVESDVWLVKVMLRVVYQGRLHLVPCSRSSMCFGNGEVVMSRMVVGVPIRDNNGDAEGILVSLQRRTVKLVAVMIHRVLLLVTL
jgi:hypothetical protein